MKIKVLLEEEKMKLVASPRTLPKKNSNRNSKGKQILSIMTKQKEEEKLKQLLAARDSLDTSLLKRKRASVDSRLEISMMIGPRLEPLEK